ncbi:hypothetical protein [Pseudooctadecabacter sp.]|uniref:hypothetical protein n=1 Tax=Pseudooctadecabacter sp. TaxID=1966338 RepID=UPI0025DCDABB|nr:hypothetical protein [Pseudooctadecabacter sp.]
MATQSRSKTADTPAKRKANGSTKLAQDPNARIIKSDEDTSLTAKVSDMAASAKDQAAQIADQVTDSVRSHAETGVAQVRKAAETGQQGVRSFEAQVRDNPLIAMGAAFGLGVAITLLIKSRD